MSSSGVFNDANANRSAIDSASVSTATLRAGSSTDHVVSSDPTLTLYSSGQASIGDSFVHGSAANGGKSPFAWTSSSTATFSFSIDGSSAFSGGANDVDTTYVYPDIFKAGTLGQAPHAVGLDPQTYNFNLNSPDFASDLLYDVAFGLTPTSTTYTLLLGATAPVAQVVDTSHGPATVNFTSQPGADFDWAVFLVTNTTFTAASRRLTPIPISPIRSD